ncbi:MAG TPA: acyl-CoA dehydrogenase family protein [Thermoplasmata archaeon]|nr:acyl-CoA dehydrogenase family protein [Thermoplasmata archaeon]
MSESPYHYLSHAYGRNHFTVDRPFQAILRFHLNSVPDLSRLGEFAGKDLYEVADYVDKFGHPEHIMWSVDGERVDRAWMAPSEMRALDWLMTEAAVNRGPYRRGDWFEHFAVLYLVADPGIGCILTVTNQTAYAIYKYGDASAKAFLPSLLGEGDRIRYGATWFTEIQGGSDLGANRVQASFHEGGWTIDGDTKYFASNAGLAELALVTARVEGGARGAKGLGLFLVPEHDRGGKRNFMVRRLKKKSGTIGVPTGEVEFHRSEALLLGSAENGVYYTLENLMVSRLANSVAALGIARKAYLEAYYYAQARSAFGRRLIEHPLVRRDLLDLEVAIEGALALAFRAIEEFQSSWTDVPPYGPTYHYARLLTHIAKNITADMSAYVTKAAMELHGGVGFLREFPVERWHREALITPIWEGPSNIQALDLLEVIAKKGAEKVLLQEVERTATESRTGQPSVALARARIEQTLSSLSSYSEAEAQFFGKDVLNDLGHSIAVLQLVRISNSLHSPRWGRVAALYARKYLEGKRYDLPTAAEVEETIGIDRSPEGALPS